jgi:hypothetical protein
VEIGEHAVGFLANPLSIRHESSRELAYTSFFFFVSFLVVGHFELADEYGA